MISNQVEPRRRHKRSEFFYQLLARECSDEGHFSAASGYCEKILALVDTPVEKAECLLAMGQARERSGDHKAALEAYSRAFEMPQEPDLLDLWRKCHEMAQGMRGESRLQ